MQKCVLLFGKAGAVADLTKAHVKGYTRKDGAFVAEHDDNRKAAAPADKSATHDALADHHYSASTAALKDDYDKAEKLHDAAGMAHERAARAHKAGDANADELSAAAHAASEKANAVFEHKRKSSAPVTKTGNEGNGFHGAAYHSARREKYGADGDVKDDGRQEVNSAADGAFSRVAHELVQNGHFDKHEDARDFLDSTAGRHLGDEIGHKGSVKDVKWLPKAVRQHKAANYQPGMKKSVILFGPPGAIAELKKAHVAGYTRSDGTFVAEHDDSRQAAAPKPSAPAKPTMSDDQKKSFMHHDTKADFHRDAFDRASSSNVKKTVANRHFNAAEAHAKAAYAHKTGNPKAAELSKKADELSEKANKGFSHEAQEHHGWRSRKELGMSKPNDPKGLG